MKIYAIISLYIWGSISLLSQDPSEIIRASHDAVRVSSFEAVSTLTITDSRGNERIRKSTMASRTFEDLTEKRIIKFLSPAEVQGTGILIFDYEEGSDDMWIYLPALRRTRRIVSSEKSKSFMGSEFSNSDMTSPAMEDFTYKIMGSENVGDEACWIIKRVPLNIELEDQYGYSSALLYIGKKDYIVRKSEFFGYDEALIKTIETTKFKLLDATSGKYMITGMVATNYENGRSSSMIMDNIQLAETDEAYFSVTYLER
ncbi:MAG: outer membrane lipoprotein-sorting protein [Bacteroidales bacterium]